MPRLHRIHISQTGNSLFHFHLSPRQDFLEQSIQQHGVIQPPLLLARGADFVIVDGAARLRAAKKFLSEVLCLVYDESEIDQQALLYLYLEANRWSRGFNTAEKALCLAFALKFFASRPPKVFLELLDVPDNEHIITQYQRLSTLNHSVLKFIAQLNLKPAAAFRFLTHAGKDCESIVTFLTTLPLNQSKLVQILDFLGIICRREGKSPAGVLEDVLRVVGSENDAQKREQGLRDTLRAQCQPLYEKRLSEFYQKVHRLAPQKNVQIKPAPFFEDDSVELTCRLTSQKEMQKLVELLLQKEFEGLFVK